MSGRIAFIGGGNMASALIGGLVAKGRSAADIGVVEPAAAQRHALAARYPGLDLGADAAAALARGPTLVVLAVKPQQGRAACEALVPGIHGVPAVLSILAGVRSADLGRWLGDYGRIVRAMPNTPALVGKGISGVHVGEGVPVQGREAALDVLAAAGEVVLCPRESMLDAVTGISGSGPAYVFYFIEALTEAALELGFAPADARRLAYATFDGAVTLAQRSGDDAATLRTQVTSKGGTTERGIAELDRHAVRAAIIGAARAAAVRAAELGDAAGRE